MHRRSSSRAGAALPSRSPAVATPEVDITDSSDDGMASVGSRGVPLGRRAPVRRGTGSSMSFSSAHATGSELSDSDEQGSGQRRGAAGTFATPSSSRSASRAAGPRPTTSSRHRRLGGDGTGEDLEMMEQALDRQQHGVRRARNNAVNRALKAAAQDFHTGSSKFVERSSEYRPDASGSQRDSRSRYVHPSGPLPPSHSLTPDLVLCNMHCSYARTKMRSKAPGHLCPRPPTHAHTLSKPPGLDRPEQVSSSEMSESSEEERQSVARASKNAVRRSMSQAKRVAASAISESDDDVLLDESFHAPQRKSAPRSLVKLEKLHHAPKSGGGAAGMDAADTPNKAAARMPLPAESHRGAWPDSNAEAARHAGGQNLSPGCFDCIR